MNEYLKYLIATAKGGDAEAQFELGYRNYLGIEMEEKNLNLAIKWFTKTHQNKGHRLAKEYLPWAIGDMGDAYKYGKGVLQSDELAIKWYTKADEASDEAGSDWSGEVLNNYMCIELEELRSKARAGDADAQFVLGLVFLNGKQDARNLIREDKGLAVWYFKLASQQGHELAKKTLTKLENEK